MDPEAARGAMTDAESSDQLVEASRPTRMSPCDFLWAVILTTLVMLPLLLLAGAIGFFTYQYGEPPYYYAVIGSVSGLDLTADLARRPALLQPEFNLTVRVASHTLWFKKCMDAGAYVGVAYRGVWFAASAPTTDRICVRPGKAVDHPFIARGRDVVMPVAVQDSLVGELRGGLPDSDVVLFGPERSWALSCGTRRVGDVGVLQMRCS
ncbi:hypothetical protein ZWY2020_023789 [Hordeum vulgare]|nr:hypothetical protein ZWY2020_023789 [Hordeum vulgare]